MEQIPCPLAESQEFLPLFPPTHAASPISAVPVVVLASLIRVVVAFLPSDCKSRAFRIPLPVVRRRWRSVVSFVLLPSAPSAVHRGCSGEDVRS